eukprot:Lankesteria_metandrocarpae@DN2749_c0_g1_i1.p1
MNGAFMQLRQRLLNHTFNGEPIAVLPMNYALPRLQQMIRNALTLIQYSIIAIAVWGPVNAFRFFLNTVSGTSIVTGTDNASTNTEDDVPQLVKTFEEQRYIIMAVAFMALPMLKGMLAPPAFEVYSGNTLLFSSLEHGRVPQVGDILKAYRTLGDISTIY